MIDHFESLFQNLVPAFLDTAGSTMSAVERENGSGPRWHILRGESEARMEIARIEPFLDYFERVRERTRRVIACIPPEHLEWSHKPGAFTFGDIIRHLAAIERHMFAENAQGRPSRYPGHGRELADGQDAVLAYFDEMHRQSMEIFRGLTPEDLQRRCETPGGTHLAVWKWLRSMAEHEIHHRGQIYLMLGILDIPTPPLYGLTSEEVYARSRP